MSATHIEALLRPARLEELVRLQLLDTPPEETFDRLTRVAARALKAPVALVSLVDDHRQFFKSAQGLPEPWASLRETPLTHSFCQHVVANAAPLVVNDALSHPLVRNNRAVTDLNVIAYLGIPLITAHDNTLGSFCVIDTLRREWSVADQLMMTDLAASVMSEIELRAAGALFHTINASLQRETIEHARLMQALRDSETVLATTRRLVANGGAGLDQARGAPFNHRDELLEAQRSQLTSRQRDVFDLLMQGLQTKEAALQLNLSPRTVEVHRANILSRLQIRSFSQLLRQILEHRDATLNGD